MQVKLVQVGKRRALATAAPLGRVMYDHWLIKTRIRAKVEYPFRLVKRQFGHVKACCECLVELLRLWRIKNYCQ